MIFNKLSKYISLAIILIVLFSCKSKVHKQNDEGVIVYDLSFPKIGSVFFLPKEMTTHFKKNKTRIEMSAMGFFKIIYIADTEKKEVIKIIEIIGSKYACKFNEEELKEEIASLPTFDIDYSGDADKILGYNCKKAVITNEETDEKFAIYYSEELGTKNINWMTPYQEIQALLLNYRYIQNGMEMKLVAKEISKIRVDDIVFKIDKENYEWLSRKDFDEKIENLMSSVNI